MTQNVTPCHDQCHGSDLTKALCPLGCHGVTAKNPGETPLSLFDVRCSTLDVRCCLSLHPPPTIPSRRQYHPVSPNITQYHQNISRSFAISAFSRGQNSQFPV